MQKVNNHYFNHMKKQIIMLLSEQNFVDGNGKSIKNITGITTFKNGIVLMTKTGIYSNIRISDEWINTKNKGK